MVLELKLLFSEILNFSIFPNSYLQEVRNYRLFLPELS
jgi:hypothetical protein